MRNIELSNLIKEARRSIEGILDDLESDIADLLQEHYDSGYSDAEKEANK